MTGATQGSSQKTDKKEITGAGQEQKRDRAEVKLVVIRKKNHFFHGEVFFLLTGPLMDDPFFM